MLQILQGGYLDVPRITRDDPHRVSVPLNEGGVVSDLVVFLPCPPVGGYQDIPVKRLRRLNEINALS